MGIIFIYNIRHLVLLGCHEGRLLWSKWDRVIVDEIFNPRRESILIDESFNDVISQLTRSEHIKIFKTPNLWVMETNDA